jgi:electron transfer flavoprotein beta subunit
MNFVVLFKMVPDTVEELEIGSDGKSLDTQWLRTILSEPDDNALEQAIILKEKHGGKVTVVAFDAPEVDDVFFTALAKGADRAVKIMGDWTGVKSPATSKIAANFIKSEFQPLSSETLILTGSQAIDDLEGEAAPYLGFLLGIPFIGVVTGVAMDAAAKKITVIKEFTGGLRGEFELPLPSVLGIQSAEKPPRYVPVAKVRGMMKTAKIDEIDAAAEARVGVSIEKMFKPELAGRAEMMDGSPEVVAGRIADLLAERGLI